MLPAEILKVLINSSFLNKYGKRMIKFRGWGKIDVRTSHQLTPWGIDCNPIKGIRGVNSRTQKEGATVLIGYIHKHVDTETGEVRLFATNDDDEEQIHLWLKKNGTMELGGNADFAVRFSKLEEAYNELQGKYNALLAEVKAHVHPFVGLAVGVSGATSAAVFTTSNSTGDISQAKVDNVKLGN